MSIGVGADHGGFQMKQELAERLSEEGHVVVDFGNKQCGHTGDYPDFAVPLAQAVARGAIERGILVCGSGVGASPASNKVPCVRAALCHDAFTARQAVEDDDMNVLCVGGRTTGIAVAWDCELNFLRARFSGADRHQRRLAKVCQFESQSHASAVS